MRESEREEGEGEHAVVADRHAQEGGPALVEELLVRATHALAQLRLAAVGDVPVRGAEREAGNGGRDTLGVGEVHGAGGIGLWDGVDGWTHLNLATALSGRKCASGAKPS